MILTALILFFVLSYIVFGILLQAGWNRMPAYSVPDSFIPFTSVSLIIPVRNEIEHIGLLLQQILDQQYPKELLMVYIVDDHSTDGSTTLIQEWCSKHPNQFHYRTVSSAFASMKGKKKAIATAINESVSELIMTTDADCRVGPDWVRTMVYAYEQNKPVFVSGPVKMVGKNTAWGRFQEIEFASLIGSGASAIGLGKALMCNGANLAYSREAYVAVQGFEGNEQIASGDDEFLMHKMALSFPGRITFIKNKNAVAETDAPPTWNSFMQQRKRWASKWSHYTNWYVQAVALWVFSFHFMLLLSVFLVLSGILEWYWMISLWAVKACIDYFYLKSVARFLSVGFKMPIFINSLLIYPVYVVTFGLLSRFGRYDWKERSESVS